ncbi:unnamed protein product [Zymoseptoria tritici ST99CH_3D1]|nr:unnamed protein product [Zymoseptoria tritici ST99CH_3D1]
MAKDQTTSFYFLPRDQKWKTGKPYTLKFTPKEDFPIVNANRVERSGIHVEDMRGKETSFSFDENGFAVMPPDLSDMSYEDYYNDEMDRRVFLQAVGDRFKGFLQAKRVQVFDSR